MQLEIRTLSEDRSDLRWGASFLGLLLAIPVAGLLGLPLLVLLLVLFLCNPGGLGTNLSRSPLFKHLPGFRSGQPIWMALASLCYLLPLSALGMIVVGVDGVILGIWP